MAPLTLGRIPNLWPHLPRPESSAHWLLPRTCLPPASLTYHQPPCPPHPTCFLLRALVFIVPSAWSTLHTNSCISLHDFNQVSWQMLQTREPGEAASLSLFMFSLWFDGFFIAHLLQWCCCSFDNTHPPPLEGSLGREDPLEEGMATHSSILAWRIPQTEEPGGLRSIGSQRVRYDWINLALMHTPTGVKAVRGGIWISSSLLSVQQLGWCLQPIDAP